MAANLQPHIQTFLAGGTIVEGHAVKFGADKSHIVECTAASDKSIGIAQSGTTTTEDPVEVARPGGGAKAVAQTTIALGDALVSHTDGTLKPSTTTGERIIGFSDQDAVVGDIFAMTVERSLHY